MLSGPTMLSSVEERFLPNDMFATHRDLFDTFDANTGLYRTIAYSICRNHDDAEDALQDACVNLLSRKLPRRGSNLVQWVARVVTNAAIDHQRRLHRHPTSELCEGFDQPLCDCTDWPLVDGYNYSVEQMLKELPTDQREATFLVDVIGFTLQETAKLVGAPLGTVKSRRNRARARLVQSATQDALLLQSA